MCSLLLVLYTYVGGSFASVQRQRPRQFQGGSCQEPNCSKTLKEAGARAVHNCNAGRSKSVLAVLSTKICNECINPHPLLGRAGVEKCSASWTRTQALSPQWHDGDKLELVAKRDVKSNSQLETTQRRPPPSYDAHLTRCVMTFQ